MIHQKFQKNCTHFSKLIDELSNEVNNPLTTSVKRYVDQNIFILNDVLDTSIDYLMKLQTAQSTQDVIAIQARFANDITKRLCIASQRFLNTSLEHVSDYNEWLKLHCDLATD